MSYDVAVIGSGPGGYTAAFRAGQYGLKTAIVEKYPKLGGTCLHVGCIPTKALLHAAEVWGYFRNPAEQGIHCENPRLDLPLVLERKDKVVGKHAKGLEFLAKKNKVESIAGTATLAGRGRILVRSGDGERTIDAQHIILATGSEARMLPGLAAGSDVLTNVEILEMADVPTTLAIIGAGAVGVEFASIFSRFGTKVTLLEMLPRLVPVEDEEVSKELERCFRKSGIRCEAGAAVEEVERRPAGGVRLRVTLASKKTETIEAEKLLVAVGRRPMTDAIGLENTRAETDRGFIRVNQYQQTAEPGLYAIGDIVAGTPQLAHVASMEGLVAVAHIAGKSPRPVHVNRIPGVTYTEPGIGSVGLTEARAREAGYKVKVGKFPFLGNSKATILGHHDGFVKVVADETYGEILGVHIIGPHGYELISEAVTAMEAEATVDTMTSTIHAHPTLYEAVGEAFQAIYGMSINA